MNPNIIPLNDHTWRIEDGFVRYFLITGSEKAMLIDSGVSTPDVKTVAESITSLPLVLLNTHGDMDHIAGNGAFESFYMTQADYDGCGVAARFPDSQCLPLQDGDTFSLGGRTLEVIAIPGHTAGSVAILDREGRALFGGDSVQNGNIYMFGPHRRPDAFAASLRKLADRAAEYDVIYPSHAAPELPADYAQKVLNAWEEALAGDLPVTRENLFGNPVDTHTAAVCGFYCNPKE